MGALGWRWPGGPWRQKSRGSLQGPGTTGGSYAAADGIPRLFLNVTLDDPARQRGGRAEKDALGRGHGSGTEEAAFGAADHPPRAGRGEGEGAVRRAQRPGARPSPATLLTATGSPGESPPALASVSPPAQQGTGPARPAGLLRPNPADPAGPSLASPAPRLPSQATSSLRSRVV